MSTGGAFHSGVNAGGTGAWRAPPPRLGPPHLTLTMRRTGQFQGQPPGHPERPPRSTPTRPYLRAPTRPQPDCACASSRLARTPGERREDGGPPRAHRGRFSFKRNPSPSASVAPARNRGPGGWEGTGRGWRRAPAHWPPSAPPAGRRSSRRSRPRVWRSCGEAGGRWRVFASPRA